MKLMNWQIFLFSMGISSIAYGAILSRYSAFGWWQLGGGILASLIGIGLFIKKQAGRKMKAE